MVRNLMKPPKNHKSERESELKSPLPNKGEKDTKDHKKTFHKS